MDTDVIFNNAFQFSNKDEALDFRRWLSTVNEIIAGADLSAALKDPKFLCKMFYAQKTSGVSRTRYQEIKKHIFELQKSLNLPPFVPVREDVLKSQELTCYFKDLDAIIDFINKTGELNLKDYYSNLDLLNIKSIVILGWYGFSLKEISIALKSSIYSENANYYIKKGENCVQINEIAYDILMRFAASLNHRGLPSGRTQIYKSDDRYLFRSIDERELVNENNLVNVLKRFNQVIEKDGFAIVFRNLRKNALFAEIYNDTAQGKTAEKIMNRLKCDKQTAYGIEKEYTQWVIRYHS